MTKPFEELTEALDDLAGLLKSPDVGASLAERGVNASIALLAVDGVRAYVAGDKLRAAEDFDTCAEEIAARAAIRERPS